VAAGRIAEAATCTEVCRLDLGPAMVRYLAAVDGRSGCSVDGQELEIGGSLAATD
jgi:hypothetical protein